MDPAQWHYEEMRRRQFYEAGLAAAAAEMQAQEALLEESREAARRTGALCELPRGSGPCRVLGAGWCRQCGRVFCRTHQSGRPAEADLCSACQDAIAEMREMARREAVDREERVRRERKARVEAEQAAHESRIAQRQASRLPKGIEADRLTYMEANERLAAAKSTFDPSPKSAWWTLLVAFVLYECLLGTGKPIWAGIGAGIAEIICLAVWGALYVRGRRAAGQIPLLVQQLKELRFRGGCGDSSCWRCYGSDAQSLDPGIQT